MFDEEEEDMGLDLGGDSGGLGLAEAEESYASLLSQTLMGCLESQDVFQRKNLFEGQLEKIIEEVSNEAFSSMFNPSTLVFGSEIKADGNSEFSRQGVHQR